AAVVDERIDPGATPVGLVLAWPSGKIERLGARGLECTRSVGSLLVVDRIRTAQTGKPRTGGLEGGDQSVADCKAVMIDRLDPARCKEIRGKGRALAEVGGCAKVGEKDLLPRASGGQHAVGGVAQRLIRLRKSYRCEGHNRDRDRHWCSTRARNIKHCSRRLAEIGKLIGADEDVLAGCDCALALRAHSRDLALNEPV